MTAPLYVWYRGAFVAIGINADTKKKEKTKKYWRRLINIGPAENLMRYDVRAQVQYLKEHLGFEYMRFWQFFSEKMMIHIDEKNTKYKSAITIAIVTVNNGNTT